MKNKVRFILSVLLIALSLGSAKSQNIVNESIARKIGTNFISHNSNRTSPTLKLTHTEIGADRQANLYIFNIEGGGFVIVSALKETNPILAYSFKNDFGEEIPATASYFINNYNNTINYLKENENDIDKLMYSSGVTQGCRYQKNN